jgi:hypothetical protein
MGKEQSMAKGLLRLNADIVAEWFVAGLGRYDVQTLLKLPDHYVIEDISMDDAGQHVVLTVSSPHIPEVAPGLPLPEIIGTYDKVEGMENGRWHLPDSYVLTHLKATIVLPKE